MGETAVERRRATDPAIKELHMEVTSLRVELRGHIEEETCELEENSKAIDKNNSEIAKLHTKMDSMLELAQVWQDVKGTSKVTKWVAGTIILFGGAWAAIDKWIIK